MRAPLCSAVSLSALSLSALFLSACPPPDDLDPPVPLEVTATVAADAPLADARDAPPTEGLLPEGVPASVTLIDLGLLGVDHGASGEIRVQTRGLGSITVLVWGQPDATVILQSVLDPDGAAVVSDEDPADLPAHRLAFARGFPGQAFSVNRVLGSAQTGAFLVPNTPAVRPDDGTWRLRVGHWQVDDSVQPNTRAAVDRPVRVMLLVRGQDTGAGHVDVNLHFSGGDGLTAATAAEHPLLQGALDVVREAWGGVGIRLGEPRLRDIDPVLATITLAPGRCDGGQLTDLLAAGRGAEPGLDLFLIDGFVCILNGGVDVGDAIGGIASGIPGPAWVHGSPHSGVAVSTSFALGDPRPLGVVMAHELSHFLGLFHTKESGVGGDFIEDEIADSPSGDDADENLMYFAADADISLSEGQGLVLRSSPFVIPD